MSILSTVRLDLDWSVSRGRETYGYNICKLTDTITGKKYKTIGGGYDMVGTVLGDWMTDVLQDDLLKIKERAYAVYTDHRFLIKSTDHTSLYGMTYHKDTGKVAIDGACGESSVMRIFEALGYSVEYLRHGKKHNVIGYYIFPAE
jgi:hypothetical protein